MKGQPANKYEDGTILGMWRSYGLQFCQNVRYAEHRHPVLRTRCWLWTSGTSSGYGSMRFGDRNDRTHRISWVLFRGDIPKGMYVLHRCDVHLCVNPDHLFLGTHDDNMSDAAQKERMRYGEEHHGAKLTEDDVRQIRNLFSRGSNKGALARAFRISRSVIQGILKGEGWRHVK